MKSSIIDVPRTHTQDDLFGIEVYQQALIDYVKLTDTPITIALQGEWGSGKTSLMNLLRWNLCDVEGAEFYPIWINTWQYSLLKSPGQTIVNILEGIINQIGNLNPNANKWEESKKKIGGIFRKMATIGTKVVANQVGIDGSLVDDIFAESGDVPESDIAALKAEITKLIADSLAHNPHKKGFIFYIDDLDRIDPPMAVEILELLKNIFDIENCIFILAIDYDVVIKGLKPKFGELTEKNEREFRSFFDKIIQLPFSMPVASYKVDTFLVNALEQIDFFTPKEMGDATLAENLSEISRLSVGTNPRSLKRLTNTLSLISLINKRMQAEESDNTNKLINFALVCMQIAYPYIYNQLTEEPDFKAWNEKVASKLKLRPLTPVEEDSLNATGEFDEPWEKVVFRMCQKETFLSNRAFQVSALLNKISEIIGDDARLGEVVEATLELSAVTNLKAFDTPKKITKFNRDNSNYRFNDVVYTKKTDLVYSVIRYYIQQKPQASFEQLKEDFRFQKNMDAYFMLYEDYEQELKEKGVVNFFRVRSQDDCFELADKTVFVVAKNWPTTVQGKPGAFMKFIDVVQKNLGYKIASC